LLLLLQHWFIPAGCWKDEFPPTGRALPNLIGTSANMTVDMCAKLAASANYSVFALQYAVECYAGEYAGWLQYVTMLL
jgi:hypothetical protein